MTIAASLAQIGEFSFILAGLGVGLKVMPEEARDLILAGSILSILFNPLFFTLAVRRMRAAEPPAPETVVEAVPDAAPARTVLIGYGLCVSHIADSLGRRGEASPGLAHPQ